MKKQIEKIEENIELLKIQQVKHTVVLDKIYKMISEMQNSNLEQRIPQPETVETGLATFNIPLKTVADVTKLNFEITTNPKFRTMLVCY